MVRANLTPNPFPRGKEKNRVGGGVILALWSRGVGFVRGRRCRRWLALLGRCRLAASRLRGRRLGLCGDRSLICRGILRASLLGRPGRRFPGCLLGWLFGLLGLSPAGLNPGGLLPQELSGRVRRLRLVCLGLLLATPPYF